MQIRHIKCHFGADGASEVCFVFAAVCTAVYSTFISVDAHIIIILVMAIVLSVDGPFLFTKTMVKYIHQRFFFS